MAAESQEPLDVVMIDNYDSFTFNLVQYLEELGARVTVFRHDKITGKRERKEYACVIRRDD